MNRPRLVATDLDGTLVRSDGTVSAYTHEVIAALDDRGVPVVFVTGRPLRWAEAVFDYVGAHGLAIVSNGAVVYDVAAGGVREVAGIAPDDGLDAHRRDLGGGAGLVVRDRVPGRHPARHRVRGAAPGPGGQPGGSARPSSGTSRR